MIASMTMGLLQEMGGGSVQPGTGEFNFMPMKVTGQKWKIDKPLVSTLLGQDQKFSVKSA